MYRNTHLTALVLSTAFQQFKQTQSEKNLDWTQILEHVVPKKRYKAKQDILAQHLPLFIKWAHNHSVIYNENGFLIFKPTNNEKEKDEDINDTDFLLSGRDTMQTKVDVLMDHGIFVSHLSDLLDRLKDIGEAEDVEEAEEIINVIV